MATKESTWTGDTSFGGTRSIVCSSFLEMEKFMLGPEIKQSSKELPKKTDSYFSSKPEPGNGAPIVSLKEGAAANRAAM